MSAPRKDPLLLSCLLASAIALVMASTTSAQEVDAAPVPPASCLSPGIDQPVKFEGRVLRDSPALQSSAARTINARLSRGECMESARLLLAAQQAERPDDAELLYLEARSDALEGQRGLAERKAAALLESEPGMTPAAVLQAGLLLDREQRDQARAILEAASAAQPDDLRAAFQLLRVHALADPKGRGPSQLFRVLRDDSLPPDLRETAQATLLYITALDLGQKEAALREALRFESQTPRWDKSNALGRLLAEESGKTGEARTVLQAVLDDADAPDPARAFARLLIAESWLLDAARLDPAPTPRNAELVARAKAQMGEDAVPLASRIRRFHDLTALRPFVADIRDAEERGSDGLTALCRGAQLMDGAKVRAALAAGAAVDGECAGSTALAFVVRSGPGLFSRKQPVVAALLEAGADPDVKLYPSSTYTALSFCEELQPGCAVQLLPMLREAKARTKPASPPAADSVTD
jgi:hypothetical protein